MTIDHEEAKSLAIAYRDTDLGDIDAADTGELARAYLDLAAQLEMVKKNMENSVRYIWLKKSGCFIDIEKKSWHDNEWLDSAIDSELANDRKQA